MSPRKFDRFMIAVGIGSNPKIGRLTDAEFRCLVAGVWPIAAVSPVRGRLLIGDMRAEARDIAHQAHVSERVAERTLEKLRALGMLIPDGEFDCERCHDWEEINPPPKKDPTNAERQARHRALAKARNAARNGTSNANVTPLVTPTEVEEEVEAPFDSPASGGTATAPIKPGGNRKTDQAAYREQFTAWAAQHFPGAPVAGVEQIVTWMRSHGKEPLPDAVRQFAADAPNFAHLLEPSAA